MADLGTINTINPNAGTQPVDNRALESGIQQALGAVAAIHTRNVIKDVTDDVQEGLSQSAADLNEPEGVEVRDADLTDEENDIRTKVLELRHTVRNGDSGLRLRAELEVSKIMEKARREHPRLATMIQAEINAQVSTSSALVELGMEDTFRDAAALVAKSQLDDMLNRAVKLISAGGLGMEITTNLANPEHLRDFISKDAQRARIEGGKLSFAVAKADAAVDSKVLADAAIKVIVGKDSGVHLMLMANARFASKYFLELQKSSGEQDINLINSFAAQKNELVLENNMVITQIQSEMLELGANAAFRASPEFAALQVVADDRVALIQRQVDQFNGIATTDFATITEAAYLSDVYETARDNTPLATVLRIMAADENGGLLTLLGRGVVEGGLTDESLSSIAEQALQGFLNYPLAEKLAIVIKTSGGTDLEPDTTADEIKRAIRNEQRQGSTPYGRNDSTEEMQILEALSQQQMVATAFKIMKSLPETATPENAGRLLTTSTYGMSLMNDLGDPAENQVQMTLASIASPAYLTGIQTVGDDEFMATRLAWADEAQDFIGNMHKPVAQQRKENFAAWTADYFGGEFKDAVDVKLDTLNEDQAQLTGEVNAERVADIMWNEFNTRPRRPRTPSLGRAVWAHRNESLIQKEVRGVAATLSRLLKAANIDIRSAAHVSYAGAPSVSAENRPMYALWANRMGYLDILGIK